MILTVHVVLQFVFKILYSSIVVYLLFCLSPVIPFTVDPYVLLIKILSFFTKSETTLFSYSRNLFKIVFNLFLFFLFRLLKKWFLIRHLHALPSISYFLCSPKAALSWVATGPCLPWRVDIPVCPLNSLSTLTVCPGSLTLMDFILWICHIPCPLTCGWQEVGAWNGEVWVIILPAPSLQDCRWGVAGSYTKGLAGHCLTLSFSTARALSGFW